jgi:hypothetical protein
MIIESKPYQLSVRVFVGWVGICATIGTLGCSKANGNTGANATTTAAVAEVLPMTPEGVLNGYENVRRLLAEDQVATASSYAKQLTSAAHGVVQNKSVGQLPVFERIAGASSALASIDAKDSDAVRRQFGEVSRAIVELLVENEALRGSRVVFECPMAQGYRKWVQLTPTINNPYMGSKMLECGAASKWTP